MSPSNTSNSAPNYPYGSYRTNIPVTSVNQPYQGQPSSQGNDPFSVRFTPQLQPPTVTVSPRSPSAASDELATSAVSPVPADVPTWGHWMPPATHDSLDGVRRHQQPDAVADRQAARSDAAFRFLEEHIRQSQQFQQQMLESFQREAESLQQHRAETRRMQQQLLDQQAAAANERREYRRPLLEKLDRLIEKL